MYDIYIKYLDESESTYMGIKYIEIPSTNGVRRIPDDEVLTHNFYINGPFFLHSDDQNCTVSIKNVKSIEIRKK